MSARRLAAVLVLLLVVPAARAVAADGLRATTIPQASVRLGVPKDFRDVTPPQQLKQLGVVYLTRTPNAHSGFRANLNLLVGALAPGQTVRSWMVGSNESLLLRSGSLGTVRIGGRNALHYRSTKLGSVGPGRPLLTDEYAFQRGRKVLLFTYTALAGDKSTYLPLFTASARTIRL